MSPQIIWGMGGAGAGQRRADPQITQIIWECGDGGGEDPQIFADYLGGNGFGEGGRFYLAIDLIGHFIARTCFLPISTRFVDGSKFVVMR